MLLRMCIHVYMLLQTCVCTCIHATTYMSTSKHASYIHIHVSIYSCTCMWLGLSPPLPVSGSKGGRRGACVCGGGGGHIQGVIAIMMAGSVLQRVGVCWSVLQCVAVCCNVAAVFCSMRQRAAVHCSVLQREWGSHLSDGRQCAYVQGGRGGERVRCEREAMREGDSETESN